MENKDLFEQWLICQFGEGIKSRIALFDIKEGYADETINTLWIGFSAGVELSINL